VVFPHREFDDHEHVLFCNDPSVGLQAVIAIHSTALGPAAGGCRMQPYASIDDAVADVLRLSQGMSYKNAMASLPLGGGKCVIIADPAADHKDDLLRAFSHHVEMLGGRFWTAIDVGVGPEDAEVLAENCSYIFANASRYPAGFDPSSYTALGGFTSIRAAATHVWGSDDLAGKRVAIQGLGATGSRLAEHLAHAGAELVVADTNNALVADAIESYGATAAAPDDIHAQDVDIFAPCALGGVLNDETIPQLSARVVCGMANNQLHTPHHGQVLRNAGITYVPDYVANGGGITAAGAVIYSDPTDDENRERVLGLFDTVLDLLDTAARANRPTSVVADEIAQAKIGAAQASSS